MSILTEYLRWLLLNVVEIWNLKNELIKTLSHKISITERNITFRRKRQCQKEVMYEYILAFVGWWSIFWEVIGSGGYILAGGGGDGWWWVLVGSGNIFWLVVGGGGWWWIYLAGGGWWWMVVDDGGSWWTVVGSGIV